MKKWLKKFFCQRDHGHGYLIHTFTDLGEGDFTLRSKCWRCDHEIEVMHGASRRIAYKQGIALSPNPPSWLEPSEAYKWLDEEGLTLVRPEVYEMVERAAGQVSK